MLVKIGFEVVESRSGIAANYTVDERSMLQSDYRCVHFVARKTATPTTNGKSKG
jgi:N2227-like protein